MPPQFSRSDADIVSWMTKSAASIPSEASGDDLDELLKSEDKLFVACFKEGMPQLDEFTSAALTAGVEAKFVWATTKACAGQFAFTKVGLLYKKKGEAHVVVTKDFEADNLVDEMQGADMPDVVEMMEGSTLTLQSLDTYGDERLRMFLFADPEDSGYSKMKESFVEASKRSKAELGPGRPLFAIVSSQRKALMFKFKVTTTPTLFAVESGRSYDKCEGDISSADDITKYAAHVTAPDTQSSKSDEPAWDDKQFITRVVAKDFEQRVINGNKPVFLYIMLPTCQTCKAYAARVLQIAKTAKTLLPDIQFAKFDASTNDFEHPSMKEFENKYPNFVLFMPGQKKGVPFPHDMVRVTALVYLSFTFGIWCPGLYQSYKIRCIQPRRSQLAG
jgi:hypothetical protein